MRIPVFSYLIKNSFIGNEEIIKERKSLALLARANE